MSRLLFEIDKKEILRYAGRRGASTGETVDRAAEKAGRLIMENIAPKNILRRYTVTQLPEGVLLQESGVILQGDDIKKHLDGCTHCRVLCATIGHGADRFIRTMQAVGRLDGLMADAAATAAIEAYCDRIEADLRRRERRQGRYLTWRYSPGYGDFPFEQQPRVLSMLEAEKYIGVHCNRACMMIPSKSVTAVMGIADKKPRRSAGKCANCPNRDSCNFSCR